ncbi:hypothetical protein [Pseudarthrobacter sp. NamE5]|uniref:hypothetical protein n=1 Tax=Pseudarthrobacter sp. NamE5 TaxID=2576839 RepID=UPI0011685D6D|nr:hypothetical protein [Pseudarthrobacter sp. NamE5]TLM88209.1 hypothetical protein FDW84_01435 [Pseudarthrobacter sp. NamE5]
MPDDDSLIGLSVLVVRPVSRAMVVGSVRLFGDLIPMDSLWSADQIGGYGRILVIISCHEAHPRGNERLS